MGASLVYTCLGYLSLNWVEENPFPSSPLPDRFSAQYSERPLNQSVDNWGRSLKRGYVGEALRGVPRLPDENVDFVQVEEYLRVDVLPNPEVTPQKGMTATHDKPYS